MLPGTSHCGAGKIFTTKALIHRVIPICALPALLHHWWEDSDVLAVFNIPILGKPTEMCSWKNESKSRNRSLTQNFVVELCVL